MLLTSFSVFVLCTGAGAIISQGAMAQAPFPAVQKYLEGMDWVSGDAMLSKVMWDVLRIAPTDPGAHSFLITTGFNSEALIGALLVHTSAGLQKAKSMLRQCCIGNSDLHSWHLCLHQFAIWPF